MAEKKKLVTFELKDLTYDEIINVFNQVNEFISFLESSKVEVSKRGNIDDQESDDKKQESTPKDGESNES